MIASPSEVDVGKLRIPFECEPAEELRKLVALRQELRDSVERGNEYFRSGKGDLRQQAVMLSGDVQHLGVVEYVLGAPAGEVLALFRRAYGYVLELLMMRDVPPPRAILEISVGASGKRVKRIEEEASARYPLNHYERALYLAIITRDVAASTAMAQVDENLYDPPGQGMPKHESESVRALRALVLGENERALTHMAQAYRARKKEYWEWYFLMGEPRPKPTPARTLLDHPYAAIAARDSKAVQSSLSLLLKVHSDRAEKDWAARGFGFPHHAIMSLPALACYRLACTAGLAINIESAFLPLDLIAA